VISFGTRDVLAHTTLWKSHDERGLVGQGGTVGLESDQAQVESASTNEKPLKTMSIYPIVIRARGTKTQTR